MIGMFFIALAGCAVLNIFLHIWLNRFKIQLKRLILLTSYSLALAAILTFTSIFRDKVPVILYIILLGAVLGPVFVKEIYSVIKGRQPVRHVAFLIIGVILCTLFPYMNNMIIGIVLMAAGLGFLFAFFHYMHRYPYLNPMWLETVINETADKVKQGCKYTSKPVVVEMESDKTMTTGITGLEIIIKRDKSIIRISRKKHRQLNQPNLEEFAGKLITTIFNRMD